MHSPKANLPSLSSASAAHPTPLSVLYFTARDWSDQPALSASIADRRSQR